MKLERLISIIYKLLNNDVLPANALAEEFQVSQRTIYRDIDVICAAGFPVVSYQGNKGGFGMMEGFKMDKSLLGSYDVNALVTVLKGLSTVFEDERAQGTIERLQTVGTERRTPSLAVDFETRRTDPETLPLLRAAITERKVIRFDYINAKNERTTRELEPVRLHFKYGSWYIYGYCLTRCDYREFRLSRMVEAFQTERCFEPHREVPEEAGPFVGDQSLVEDVVVKVGPEALADAMDQFGYVPKTFHSDGSMTMRIPVYKPAEATWLWSILLGFGSGAEVLEPLELRAVMKEQLRKTLNLYE
ncbi:helix-turn-helix transcriptional regulator [Paenibacillus glycanilyticus]|uniref:helix-turn-helix transcriptional regulator n=1 Tax=Paenibacillus glycanilyticus TaxID=126569 RepID=UPI000FD7C0B8|nr:YafY family protein [Paenibacillus glycanilyticus]